ncbi:MAG: S41 family peptidase [Longimicrobiales bacterium]
MTRSNRLLVLLPALALPMLAAPALDAQSAQSSQTAEAEVFLQALQALSRMHQNAPTDSLLWEAALDGMIESLEDPYAAVFTPVESEQWEEDTTGNYSGIGLQITQLNDEVTVTAVFRSTPASDIGVQVGDVIVGVNEHDASDWTTDMAADSIRGPVGSWVSVRFKRQGYDEPIVYDIKRDNVHVPAVNYGVLEGNIGYAVLDRVARNAAREMDQALRELQSTRGLIIDLRRNPGGFLDESLMLADLFLTPGSTLASTSQRLPGGPLGTGAPDTDTESYEDRWPARVPDLPVVILVDRFTASGAEILAGALQDYDRAVVLGERTFGKGVVQTVMPLRHGRRLRFTTGEWQTPLGRSLHRPRDMEMRPLTEDLDTFPRIQTALGRSLIDGGGIFPDLAVADDTLRTEEQELIRTANEVQFPLGLRLAEFALEQARVRREAGTTPGVDDAAFEGFLDAMIDEGLPAELVEDPVVRDYLHWRSRINVALRMDQVGREADFRMERDPVLEEAVRLLNTHSTQADLFRAVDSETEARGASGTPPR